MNIKNILKNIIEKQGTATEFNPITDTEIDEMFGTAAGTGTDAQDYVVEHGTDGIWTYRKWASGIAECWGKYNWTSVNITNTWGSMYTGTPSPATIDFPTGLFVDAPICRYCPDSNGANYWLATNFSSTGVATKDHTQAIQPVRPTSATNCSVIATFHAKGTWK